jgi:lipopolysaccharide biosynthesis regulator YciM
MTEVWQDLWPWLLGALVLVLGAVAVWLAMRRPAPRAPEDLYGRALETWLAGDLQTARDLMRDVVSREPSRIEPYLHLGILLRQTGDPGRAAALHRSLAVRPDLPPSRRVTVGLELASDLVDLRRLDEADAVLNQLAGRADGDVRWHRLRFAAAARRGDVAAAAEALRAGERRLGPEAGAELAEMRAAWLVDGALMAFRGGDVERARSILGRARGLPRAAGRAHLVQALVAAHDRDPDAAVKAVAAGLAEHPAEMAPVLPQLEAVLLDTGRFTRVVPILEAACADATAPPELWMALARLYEKLDRRDDALRLLGGKRGDPRLTPDAAAPYLRLLTAEVPDAAFTRVWNLLGDPDAHDGHVCAVCGRHEDDVRWFCPDCLSADTFEPLREACPRPVSSTPAPAGPPRY